MPFNAAKCWRVTADTHFRNSRLRISLSPDLDKPEINPDKLNDFVILGGENLTEKGKYGDTAKCTMYPLIR